MLTGGGGQRVLVGGGQAGRAGGAEVKRAYRWAQGDCLLVDGGDVVEVACAGG